MFISSLETRYICVMLRTVHKIKHNIELSIGSVRFPALNLWENGEAHLVSPFHDDWAAKNYSPSRRISCNDIRHTWVYIVWYMRTPAVQHPELANKIYSLKSGNIHHEICLNHFDLSICTCCSVQRKHSFYLHAYWTYSIADIKDGYHRRYTWICQI